MFILAKVGWFDKLIATFFFNIDQVVYNFIIKVYDLLMSISRTSILTQGDIADMTGRIYRLLTLFMIFKVTLSLITYTVSPDNFSDKSKGVGKLAQHIVISLCVLILTPYIFNYAYKLQTMILESNALAVLIFDTDENGGIANENVLNTAGENMAYTTINAFFVPNSSIDGLYNCANLMNVEVDPNTKADITVANPNCTGLNNADLTPATGTSDGKTMQYYATNTSNKGSFDETMLKNYVAGLNNKSLGLLFRQDLATATVTVNSEETFIMDYSYILSTVTGVLILVLLINFCIDIALRSVKLAFLQIIAPIPIITYVDPKSGKDGMFMKWAKMCGSTFASLFIRLLAIYFAVYLISRIGNMVDIINGTTVTNNFIKIFIIIGALMFAKQLPEILKGLGINLEGGGKFTLNPFKKVEEGALGGKHIAGAARKVRNAGFGMAGVGAASLLTGKGFGGSRRAMWSAFKGGMKGEKFGKNFSTSYAAGKERQRELAEMKADGVTASQVAFANLYNATHGRTRAEHIKDVTDGLKAIQDEFSKYETIATKIDKIAKHYDQQLEAAKSRGDFKAMQKWSDARDDRIKEIAANEGKVVTSGTLSIGADGSVLNADLLTAGLTKADTNMALVNIASHMDSLANSMNSAGSDIEGYTNININAKTDIKGLKNQALSSQQSVETNAHTIEINDISKYTKTKKK